MKDAQKVLQKTERNWEAVATRVYGNIQDAFQARDLQEEILYLGELDSMINEMLNEKLSGKASVNMGVRITMLMRLWIMHAYEIIRTYDELVGSDDCKKIKKELAMIRIPMVKLQEKNKKIGSYIEIQRAGDQKTTFNERGRSEKVEFEKLVLDVFQILNSKM